jgi:isoamylase
LSQGVPMIVAGDECCRTQRGNNNAYCQDNALSWFDWRLVHQNSEIIRFVETLIRFRRAQSGVRRKRFLTGKSHTQEGLPDVSWFSPQGGHVDWANAELAMTCVLTAPDLSEDPSGTSRHILLMLNSTPDPREFMIPSIVATRPWRLFIDTGNPSPADIYPDLDGPALPANHLVTLTYRSLQCYVAK